MGRPGVDRAGGGGACNVLGAGSIGGAPLQEAGARPDPAAVAVADRDAPAGKRPRPMALAVWVWPCGGDSGVRRSIMTPPPPGGTLREWLVIPTLARPLPLANQWLAGCCLLACLIIFNFNYPAGGMSLLIAVSVHYSRSITPPGVSLLQ